LSHSAGPVTSFLEKKKHQGCESLQRTDTKEKKGDSDHKYRKQKEKQGRRGS
jgi:hypothetical protein